MATLPPKERETVLLLLKDYTTFYNANSISKILQISHVGAQKILKRLLQQNIVISRTIGKSIIYKLNFADDYVHSLVVFLLADEANHFKRWKEEFKELFKKDRVVLLFGSSVKDYAHANDIDLMIVLQNKEVTEVNAILKKKEEVLPKKLHAIKLNHQDLLENVKKKDKAFVDIIKNAIILYGQDKYVEIVKHVPSL
ncbi:MAG TPA: nucleotidyltransferase domain-containing protein [Candidatus Nanoarchaeia archaeon]|nr:nucleotidyltransferase domain-containing protein [Candidatus Nanoarchaeia archaeon]